MKRSKEFWTKPNRKMIVRKTTITEYQKDDDLRPSVDEIEETDSPEVRAAIIMGAPLWDLTVS